MLQKTVWIGGGCQHPGDTVVIDDNDPNVPSGAAYEKDGKTISIKPGAWTPVQVPADWTYDAQPPKYPVLMRPVRGNRTP